VIAMHSLNEFRTGHELHYPGPAATTMRRPVGYTDAGGTPGRAVSASRAATWNS
jgi:hypothetical protein